MESKTMQTKANTGHEGGYCTNAKAVLNRHSRHVIANEAKQTVIASETKQSGNVFGCALLNRAGRRAMFLLMVMVVALWATGLCFAQLADSPWPMRGHDAKHTGQSPYKGPKFANLKWQFETGGSVYSSPAIGSDGMVYVGSYDDNLYAINPDGSMKWKFMTGSWVSSSPVISSDGTVYVGSWDDNPYGTTISMP